MGILKKGKDFSPTEQVTSTKLDELVDNASFTNTSETSVAYTGTTGTCLQGGGLEVTSLGQLQIASSGVDNDNILNDTITSNKLSFIEDSVSTTSGNILVANGTTYDAEVMSGDATIAAGGALTIATDAVTPAKTSFLGTVDTTADSTAHMLIKQSDGEYDSKTLTGDVTITQAGATSISADTDLPDGVEAVTQAASDNSTKIATTAYVTTGIANALTGSGGIFGTLDQTADSTVRIFSKQSDGEYDSVTPSGDVTMTQAGAFSIGTSAVTTAKINDSAVTSAKIGSSAVTSAKIGSSAVTTDKIGSSAVTTDKINNSAVTGAKISSSAALPNGVTATTQSANDNSTKIATTAYVDTAAADPDRTYHSTSLGTSSGTIQQNTTNRPLLINFGLKSDDEIGLLALDISQNSDMSSETRVSMFTIKSDGVNPSRATVSGVVPDTWYWRVTYSGTSSASELFHVGFNL